MTYNFTKWQNKLKRATVDPLIDSDGGKEIIYKKLISSGFNPSTGTNDETYENYAINAFESNTSIESTNSTSVLSGIGYDSGQRKFFIKYEDMPRDPYDVNTQKDYIVVGGNEYQIKATIPTNTLHVEIKV